MQRYYALRPSAQLIWLLSFLGMVSLVPVWLLSLPHALTALTLTLVVLFWAGYCSLRDARLSLQHSCVAFRLGETDEAVLVLRNGRHLPVRLHANSLVTPWLVILNLKLSERAGRRSLVILPDAMGVERFRQLRVALRWGDYGLPGAT